MSIESRHNFFYIIMLFLLDFVVICILLIYFFVDGLCNNFLNLQRRMLFLWNLLVPVYICSANIFLISSIRQRLSVVCFVKVITRYFFGKFLQDIFSVWNLVVFFCWLPFFGIIIRFGGKKGNTFTENYSFWREKYGTSHPSKIWNVFVGLFSIPNIHQLANEVKQEGF